ncbi:hypothetical protein [Candidatus Caldatribacterium sp.]|uniref:hypothetical protein n=1 Tax=Candidatus Caldatribacterium sp. TaxID=2282143 RepID=UPI00383DE144|nr:hypothetical protein [Candidatus Caldatribacterium sp.]
MPKVIYQFTRERLKQAKHRLHPWGLALHDDRYNLPILFHPLTTPDQANLLFDPQLFEEGRRRFGSEGYCTVIPPEHQERLFPGLPKVLGEMGVKLHGKGVKTLISYLQFLRKYGFKKAKTIWSLLSDVIHSYLVFLLNLEAGLAYREILRKHGMTFINPGKETFLDGAADANLITYRSGKINEEPLRCAVEEKERWKVDPAKWLTLAPDCSLQLSCALCSFNVLIPLLEYTPGDQEITVRDRILKQVRELAAHLRVRHQDVIPSSATTDTIAAAILKDLRRTILRHLYAEEQQTVSEKAQRLQEKIARFRKEGGNA